MFSAPLQEDCYADLGEGKGRAGKQRPGRHGENSEGGAAAAHVQIRVSQKQFRIDVVPLSRLDRMTAPSPVTVT